MNTPDQAPKDGDFVAYLAELERRQMQANRTAAAAAPAQGALSAKAGAVMTRPVSPSGASGSANTVSLPAAISPERAAEIVRSLPVGLVIVGLVLLVAGLTVDGGGFLVLIGVLMLAQAVRAVLKAAKERARTPSQQVSALLAAHAQRKTPGK
jgi:hypothetical protein